MATTRPARSDPHLPPEEAARVEAEVRGYFDSIAPRRPAKPLRSDPSDSGAGGAEVVAAAASRGELPELSKLRDLEAKPQKLVLDGGDMNGEEYVETQYYDELNCIDKQHHTIATALRSPSTLKKKIPKLSSKVELWSTCRTRHAGRRRRDAGHVEPAQLPTVLRQASPALAADDAALHGGVVRDGLVGVDLLGGLLPVEHLLEELLHLGDPGGAADEDDLVNVGLLELGVGDVLRVGTSVFLNRSMLSSSNLALVSVSAKSTPSKSASISTRTWCWLLGARSARTRGGACRACGRPC